MTLLDAFGLIFTGTWGFISAPVMVVVYGVILSIAGLCATIAAIAVPHYGRSELRERLSAAIGGPLVLIFGLAVCVWAGSAPLPTSWDS